MTERSTLAARYEFACALIRDAGDLAHGYFKGRDSLTIKSKGAQDVVSEADLNTELLIRGRLAAHFPDDAFLGEETGLSSFKDGQGIWVVDPIDGTQPFVSGMSSWCWHIDQGRHCRHVLFHEGSARNISAYVRALREKWRHVLPRRFRRTHIMLRCQRQTAGLHRISH